MGASGLHYTNMLAGVAEFRINKKRTTETLFFLNKMVTSLANIFTMEKLVVNIIFGSISFIC